MANIKIIKPDYHNTYSCENIAKDDKTYNTTVNYTLSNGACIALTRLDIKGRYGAKVISIYPIGICNDDLHYSQVREAMSLIASMAHKYYGWEWKITISL